MIHDICFVFGARAWEISNRKYKKDVGLPCAFDFDIYLGMTWTWGGNLGWE